MCSSTSELSLLFCHIPPAPAPHTPVNNYQPIVRLCFPTILNMQTVASLYSWQHHLPDIGKDGLDCGSVRSFVQVLEVCWQSLPGPWGWCQVPPNSSLKCRVCSATSSENIKLVFCPSWFSPGAPIMGLDVGLADRVVINEEPLGISRMICMLFISWVCMGLHIPIMFCLKALHGVSLKLVLTINKVVLVYKKLALQDLFSTLMVPQSGLVFSASGFRAFVTLWFVDRMFSFVLFTTCISITLEVTLSGLLLTVNYANVLCELSVFEGLPAIKENRELYQFAGFTWNTKNQKKWNMKYTMEGPFCRFTSTLT